ncbi:MAG TPA: hypothetical protein VFL95_11060 [Gemmatimonadales bacterium]|nr:hypothetical protein [Gemmatimonadales bacterium]
MGIQLSDEAATQATAYNAGVAAAESFLRDRLADLEATCYEPEFAYWPKRTSVRRKR